MIRTTYLVLAAAPVSAIAVAAGWMVLRAPDDPPAPVDGQQTVQPSEMPVLTPSVEVDPVPPDTAAAEPAAPPPAAEPEPGPLAPAFDVVRVDADGAALIAGRAEPGALVAFFLDGQRVAETLADAQGQFVVMLTLEPHDAPQTLTLAMILSDGGLLAGQDMVVLAPRLRPAEPEMAAVLPAVAAGAAPPVEDAAGAAPPAEDAAGAAPPVEEVVEYAAAEARAPDAEGPEMAPAEVVIAEDPAREAGVPLAELSDAHGIEAESPVAGLSSAADGGDATAVAPAAPDEGLQADAPAIPAPPLAPSPLTAPPSTSPAAVAVSPAVPAERAAPVAGQRAGEVPPISLIAPPLGAGERLRPEAVSRAALPAAVDDRGGAGPSAGDAPLVDFMVGADGRIRVLETDAVLTGHVTIDAISYAADGEVRVSGRASRADGRRALRLYLDNRAAASAWAEGGGWAALLDDVAPGIYNLRVDELDAAGQVVSRFETPFLREDPALVARLFATPEAEIEAGTDGQAAPEVLTAAATQPATVPEREPQSEPDDPSAPVALPAAPDQAPARDAAAPAGTAAADEATPPPGTELAASGPDVTRAPGGGDPAAGAREPAEAEPEIAAEPVSADEAAGAAGGAPDPDDALAIAAAPETAPASALSRTEAGAPDAGERQAEPQSEPPSEPLPEPAAPATDMTEALPEPEPSSEPATAASPGTVPPGTVPPGTVSPGSESIAARAEPPAFSPEPQAPVRTAASQAGQPARPEPDDPAPEDHATAAPEPAFGSSIQDDATESAVAAPSETHEEAGAAGGVAAEAAPAVTGQPAARLITVQPGHTLWGLSHEHYGAGERYVQIFRANRSQIRDPHWIYPGQIFALPD